MTHDSYPCAGPGCVAIVCDDAECRLEGHHTAHRRFKGDDHGYCGECIDRADLEWLRERVKELEGERAAVDAGKHREGQP